jgi:di/tricarboxylate transporter
MDSIPALNLHGATVIVGLVVAFWIMARERVPITVTSLGIMGALALGFELFPYSGERGRLNSLEFFSGFGHEALIAICALMVLGRGLVMTGALEPLARGLAAVWQRSQVLAMFGMLVSCMALSGVLNDTPIVVLMTPVLLSLAARTGSSPGPLLMPMNFAVLIGGMATAIGTSTNILVVSLAAELGVPRFGIFDFTPLVLLAAGPALLYLLVIAPRLLRNTGQKAESALPREFRAVLKVLPETFADGRRLSEVIARSEQIHLHAVQNLEGRMVARLPTLEIGAGFRLHLSGTPSELKECERLLGGQLHADDDTDLGRRPEADARDEDLQMVEMIVSADSMFVDRRLGDLRFALRYGLQLIGVHREGDPPREPDIRGWRLHAGDVLLIQGPDSNIELAKRDSDLLALDGKVSLPRTRKAPLAILIMLAVVAAAASGALPIAVAAVLGAVLMLLTQCVLPRNLGKAVSAEVILLIPASLALGKALTVTGGANWVAGLLLLVAQEIPVAAVIAGIIALMSLLTNFVSNNAAAVIGTPIAIAIARELGVPPEPFALAVLFGCNLCFATPIGYQTNLIVMGAAGYRFSDFLRAGLPLTLMMIAIYAWLLPAWYGL